MTTTTTRRWLGSSGLPALLSSLHPSQPPPSLLATSSRRLGGYTRPRVIDSPLRQTHYSSKNEAQERDRRRRRRRRRRDAFATHLFLSLFSPIPLTYSSSSSLFPTRSGRRCFALPRKRHDARLRRKRAGDRGSGLSVFFSLRAASVFFPRARGDVFFSPSSALVRSGRPFAPLSLSFSYTRAGKQRTS